jgi:CheY-like chemotaxis protein
MRILVLDDERARHILFAAAWGKHHDIVQAWTADEAEKALDGDRFDLVTLDHDLGPASRGDGLRVARYIAQMPEARQPSRVCIHSANPVGAQAMIDTLLRTAIDVQRIDPLRLG